MPLLGALTCAMSLAVTRPQAARAQAAAGTGAAAERVRMVTVAPGVALEVVDWGGQGPAMVFLAGLGNSAHVFDEFAPRFGDAYHVYGITRRGFGTSSRPAGGYDAATRAHDILAVLDSLGIGRATLVGHSIAGDELSKFAVTYPDRVRALVYLEAYDYGPAAATLLGGLPVPPQSFPKVTTADSASPDRVAAYVQRLRGVRLPIGEIRATSRFDADGHLARTREAAGVDAGAATIAGTERAEYARIAAPALAIYAVRASPQVRFPRYDTFDAENRAIAGRVMAVQDSFGLAVRTRFRREVRRGYVVEIGNANHYVFLSNPTEVEQAMRAFLRTVP
jgi:non-heme chloroperoxidase